MALWPENADAWRIFTALNQDVVVDFGLGAYVLEALTADHTPAERAALLTRLGVIRTYGTSP